MSVGLVEQFIELERVILSVHFKSSQLSPCEHKESAPFGRVDGVYSISELELSVEQRSIFHKLVFVAVAAQVGVVGYKYFIYSIKAELLLWNIKMSVILSLCSMLQRVATSL